MASIETHLDVKIFVDKEKNKFLFMEADNEFVDVLFSFLTLPLGNIVRLVGKTQSEPTSVGCFSNLYQTVKSLGDEYFRANVVKNMLLHPRSSCEDLCRGLKIYADDTEPNYFSCSDCPYKYGACNSIYKDTRCPKCYQFMTKVESLQVSKYRQGLQVFVSNSFKYIITDGLQVMPVVPGTVTGLLDSLGIADFSVIEERDVKLGLTEVLELLKWTLLSTAPLTDHFISKKLTSSSVLQKPLLQISQSVHRPPRGWKIEVKVVLRKSNKEFLFIEAHRDFIDLLFSFLIGPLGRMLCIMKGQSLVGSLDALYKSAQSMDLQYYFHKDCGLFITRNLLEQKVAPHFWSYIGFELNECVTVVAKEMPVHSLWNVAGGFGCVRKGVFFVFDDLSVAPYSAASAISIYKRNNVLFSDLEERTLNIGAEEGISILRASLNSTTAISNGLLHNNFTFKEPKQEK